jgi:RyR domain
MDDLSIARIAHEANRAWCAFNGDTSQRSWDDAPDWQRSSAINGVAFHRANPDAGASASHDSWMAEKVSTGWVYGEVKNPAAVPPTHPCLVAFEALPREQQFKDALFRTICHAAF